MALNGADIWVRPYVPGQSGVVVIRWFRELGSNDAAIGSFRVIGPNAATFGAFSGLLRSIQEPRPA